MVAGFKAIFLYFMKMLDDCILQTKILLFKQKMLKAF